MDPNEQYRPATRTDFREAATTVDPNVVRTDTAPTTGPIMTHEAVTRREVREVREDAPIPPRPFSVAAGFFGWAVASFFTLVLVTLVLALIGAAAYDVTDGGSSGLGGAFDELSMMGLAGVLGSLFLAYLLGGYAAGRIGLWHGAGHGVAVVLWSALFTALAIAAGIYLGDQANALQVMPRIDMSGLTTPTLLAILGALVAMLAGAILGGLMGTRTSTARDADTGYRGTRRWRGRPL